VHHAQLIFALTALFLGPGRDENVRGGQVGSEIDLGILGARGGRNSSGDAPNRSGCGAGGTGLDVSPPQPLAIAREIS